MSSVSTATGGTPAATMSFVLGAQKRGRARARPRRGNGLLGRLYHSNRAPNRTWSGAWYELKLPPPGFGAPKSGFRSPKPSSK